jgi:hypothetical protein
VELVGYLLSLVVLKGEWNIVSLVLLQTSLSGILDCSLYTGPNNVPDQKIWRKECHRVWKFLC